LRERVAACCNFGFQGSRSANCAGLNGKMSEYHAAIALASLAAWPAMRARHAWIVEWYRRALQRMDEAALQPDYGNGWVGSTTSVILPPGTANKISQLLLRLGIETRAWWSQGCHVQPAFGDCPRALVPVTEDLGSRVLGLPHFPDMQEDDVCRVAEALSEVVGRQNWLPARQSALPRVPSRGVDLYVGGSLGAWALSLVEPRDVVHLITTEPDLADKARERGFRVILEDTVCIPDTPAADAVSIHYPRVFPASLIDSYRRMYNLHPGYLPWGRGYYPVFWALWEHTPAGATLHCITAGLDKGPIVH